MISPEILEYLKMTFGPGVAIIGLFIARGLWKLAPLVFDMIVEMRLLRTDLIEVKKYGARIDKLELDVDVAHKEIRTIKQGI